jgi:endo-1,4-beta-mannosidase
LKHLQPERNKANNISNIQQHQLQLENYKNPYMEILQETNNLQQILNKSETKPTSQVSKKTTDEEFANRQRQIQYVCSNERVTGLVDQILTHKKSGVIFCSVPKAGCTFWKRIFAALKNQVCIFSFFFLMNSSIRH